MDDKDTKAARGEARVRILVAVWVLWAIVVMLMVARVIDYGSGV